MTFPALCYGGSGILLVNDHRLRDAVLRLLTTPFPAPDTPRDPLAAFATSMAAVFPARWPRENDDAARIFHASLLNGQRLGLVAVHARNVLATDTARVFIDGLDLVRSSCGATMVRDMHGAQLYCHHCGSLL